MSFEQIVGNREIKEYLFNISKTENVSQSYLFVGTEGIGKLLFAKEFAKTILCMQDEKKPDCECKSCKCFVGQNHPDFSVINEEGNTIKIEQIREMISKVLEQPIVSNKKVYIINDCEKMTIEAQNCLLKTLEEPPKFAMIILISSRENLILNTIKSRCMTLKFKDISKEELKKYAMDTLGYTEVTEDLLESFEGSIAQAIKKKEHQDIMAQIKSVVDEFENQDLVHIMNDAKVLYDKEYVDDYLSYMTVYTYKKSVENKKYIDCIGMINECRRRLKSNCNFDMCLDSLIFDMHECVQK